MLYQKPSLQLVGANNVGHDQIVRSVIPELLRLFRRIVCVSEDHLVSFQQARQHRRHLFTAVRRSGNPGDLRDMPRIADRDSAERLDPLCDLIDKLDLLTGMLIEEQMQLVERRSSHEPMVFLVQGI